MPAYATGRNTTTILCRIGPNSRLELLIRRRGRRFAILATERRGFAARYSRARRKIAALPAVASTALWLVLLVQAVRQHMEVPGSARRRKTRDSQAVAQLWPVARHPVESQPIEARCTQARTSFARADQSGRSFLVSLKLRREPARRTLSGWRPAPGQRRSKFLLNYSWLCLRLLKTQGWF